MHSPASVTTIDCQYHGPERAAAYLIAGDGGRAALVDNNTAHAQPRIREALAARGLAPDAVDYAVITHLHLDHAGATADICEACPRATVLCHRRAVRHLVDPSRLVASAKRVYGEQRFERFYGEVRPVPEERIAAVADGEYIDWAGHTLAFYEVRGHANHHIAIHDETAGVVFTGDTFGVAYPRFQRGRRPFVFASTPPTDFDPAHMRDSIRRIAATGAPFAAPTHFGLHPEPNALAEVLLETVAASESILAGARGVGEDERPAFCETRLRDAYADLFAACGITPTEEDWTWIDPDIRINAQGLAFAARK
jgi:glyoxylase-like metal-dependent hydrolase (beta-lactamase superfamily II)